MTYIEALTVRQLREVLERVPEDDAAIAIICEDKCGAWKFDLIRADYWGARTDEPFLRLLLADPTCACRRRTRDDG